METPTRTQSSGLLVLGLLAALLSPNLVFSSTLEDQKNFFFPPFPSILSPPVDPTIRSPPVDPNFGSPPVTVLPPIVPSPPVVYHTSPPPSHGSGGGSPPSHGSGGGSPPRHGSGGGSPPSHGSGGGSPPSHGSGGGSPPSHGSGGGSPPRHGSGGGSPPVHHTPSHGGGHHHGRTPPTNCGNPTPPRHVDPSPPSHHNPSPAPPTYHYSPPPTGGGGGGGGTPAVPSFPPVELPPMTPGLPIPSPPFDPNSPPIGGSCDFWRNHPTIIWGLFGWYGTTIGSAFGVGILPGTRGANLNLVQALSNTRTDGIGALYREGTASLLNSMVNHNFPYSTSHVKDSFLAALGSNKAAAAQARVFKLANEGHMKKLRV